MTSALAPVDKTMLPSRSGRRECWAATTRDGVWAFKRLELPGTPWVVIHRATKEELEWQPTLPDCREYVAEGWAQADLERVWAHDRGEHRAKRDLACLKC